MAGASLRCGGRRFLPGGSTSAIDDGVDTPTILKLLLRGSTSARLLLLRGSTSAIDDGVDTLRGSTSARLFLLRGSTRMIDVGVDTPTILNLPLRAPTTSCSYAIYVEPGCGYPRVDAGSYNNIPILASPVGGSSHSVSSFSTSRLFTSHQPQIGNRIVLDSFPSVSSAVSTRAPQSYQRTLSGYQVMQVRTYSSEPPKSDPPPPADPSATPPPNPEICTYDAILKGIDNITSKVDHMTEKLDKTIENVENVKKDVELVKTKVEGSGDWTSIKIRGKTINLLSITSAIWAFFK